MATELTVNLPNRPGQLARLTSALGKAGVNIESIAAVTSGAKGTIHLVVKDPSAAKRALRAGGIRVSREREVLEVRLADKPGSLARVASRLGKANVNVDAVYVLARSGKRATTVIGVKDVKAAKKALGRS